MFAFLFGGSLALKGLYFYRPIRDGTVINYVNYEHIDTASRVWRIDRDETSNESMPESERDNEPVGYSSEELCQFKLEDLD